MTQEASHMRLGAMGLSHAVRCPEGWENCRLRFLSRINKPGKIDMPPDSEVSFVPMAAIGENGGLQLDQIKSLDEIGDGYTPFFDGDVVVAKITPCFENGKGALAEGLENGTAFGTTELHVVQPGEEIDGRFLFYLSISELFRKLGEGAMYGAGGQKRVPDRFIKDFRAPVPPLHLQEKIADFLDRKTAEIDTLIAKKGRLLDLLAEKRTALITRAVTKGLNPDAPMKDTGIEWLGEIPAHWVVRSVRRLSFKVKTGTTPPSTGINYFSEDGIDWYTPGDFSNGITLNGAERKISHEAVEKNVCRQFPSNSVLLVGIGATLGKVGVPSGVSSANQQINAIITLPETDKNYLAYYLYSRQNELKMMSAASTLGIINQDRTKQFLCPFPPTKEQKEIAAYCSGKIDELASIEKNIRSAVERLQEYRSALITNAVTGQINVA